jgi:hypothetical protein
MTKANDDTVIRAAVARGKKRMAGLLREAGGLMPADQAAQRLGVTTQTLDSRRTLVFIRTEDGRSGYPRFQFESERMVHGVGKVLSAIGVEAAWMQLSFFFLRLDELGGRTPVEAIRDGALDSVVRAATHFGRHGAS